VTATTPAPDASAESVDITVYYGTGR
jgi:hypothetical protein